MGASEFQTFVADPANDQPSPVTYRIAAGHAYRQAVREAIDEHGRNPYNGTISTTQGCVPLGPSFETGSRVTTEAAMRDAIDRAMDKAEKWGPAIAIRVDVDAQHGWLFVGWAAS